jgi:hypothetical protein
VLSNLSCKENFGKNADEQRWNCILKDQMQTFNFQTYVTDKIKQDTTASRTWYKLPESFIWNIYDWWCYENIVWENKFKTKEMFISSHSEALFHK